jgi:hypothetical protein
VEQIGEACGVDAQKGFVAGDLASSGKPYGNPDPLLNIPDLFRSRVYGLFFVLFAGGRDLGLP